MADIEGLIVFGGMLSIVGSILVLAFASVFFDLGHILTIHPRSWPFLHVPRVFKVNLLTAWERYFRLTMFALWVVVMVFSFITPSHPTSSSP